MVPRFLKLAFSRILLLLLGYAICRALFLFWNWTLYADLPGGQILYAFFYGLRFDISAILYTCLPLIPLWLLPAQVMAGRLWRRLELSLFAVITFLTMGVNFVDAEFVKFIGKRTSYDILFIREDVEQHSISILATYWKFLVGLFALTIVMTWLASRVRAAREEGLSWPMFMVWRVVAIGLIVVGARGGFQFKPLHPMHAYFSTEHQLGLLTLNTPFNLLKSRPRGKLRREHFFAEDRQAIVRLKEMTDLSRPPLALAKDWNVVVLILESFSLEYLGVSNDYPGYTPFLDELAKKSLFFPLNFANARRSIEGLPAVICGLPAMMDEPVITSDFSNNRLDCMPKVLGQMGYSTYFLHGAHNGSMHFDTFSNIAGFKNFVGLNEFPKTNKEDTDEYWGVLDEPMLQFAAKTIDEAPKPVFLTVFTLSSHHPYYVPPKYQGKFPKGTLEIHESIGYTDYSLRKFFETAETKPWFKNTIFVITADHTQKSDHKKYADMIGPWRVPLFIYVPGLDPKQIEVPRERITQQIDIMPSVLDLLGKTLPDRILVGQSVFDNTKPGRAYNFTGNRYWLIDPDVLVQTANEFRPEEAEAHKLTYDLKTIPAEDPRAQKAMFDLKAVVQYMTEGLLSNSLHTWGKAL